MRIIIAGDGKVGYTLSQKLSGEHDVVVIEKDGEALRRAEEGLDVLAIGGSCASVTVLREAGVASCDLLLAVTSRDELNMVCCLLARKLGARHTIARVRDPEYFRERKLLSEEMGLDLLINPEHTAAMEAARVLRYPQAGRIESFVGGRLEMVHFRLEEGDTVVGRSLAQVRPALPVRILFCALVRAGQVTIPSGETVLKAGDIAYVIGEGPAIHGFFKALGRPAHRVRSVLILGGSRVAYYLAQELRRSHIEVKIIEQDRERARQLDEALDATVILGDGTDQDLLESEHIEEADGFVSLTGRDEDNLLSAIYAKDRGVSKVVAKINRESYTDIIRRMGIDSVITPKLLAANQILRYVRAMGQSEGSAVETLYPIVDGQAEALEFVVYAKSRLVGVPLRDLPLLPEVLIAAVVRGPQGKILIPDGETMIESRDRVILVTRGRKVQNIDDVLER